MEIYTKTSFRKNLYEVLKKAQENNEPVEILSGEQNDNGTSQTMVLITKKEFNELQEAKELRYNQAINNIARIADAKAPHLRTEQEFEDWLNEE